MSLKDQASLGSPIWSIYIFLQKKNENPLKPLKDNIIFSFLPKKSSFHDDAHLFILFYATRYLDYVDDTWNENVVDINYFSISFSFSSFALFHSLLFHMPGSNECDEMKMIMNQNDKFLLSN